MSDSPESRQPEEPKVKISDRRRFTAEGQERDPSEVDAAPSDSASGAASGAAAGVPPEPPPAATDAEAPGRARSLPPASFELLVFSLALQAQMELGLGEPGEGQVPDLDVARHTIDLLAILQQKTKGNLTLEEQRLLENTLTELRFRYVQAVEQINKQAKP
jgi:Domain of unknown function (DUF1844)